MDSLRRVVRDLRLSARDAERGMGISSAQLFVLQTLADQRALSLSDLAERTLTDRSSVSVVVKRLVDRKLVTRKESPVDARRAELSLTASGRRLIAHFPDPTQARLLGALRRMSSADLAKLTVGLSAVVREMGIEDTKPRMFFEEEAPPRARRGRRAAPRG
jgi:DNA-binding MarR family transcriptional regulator